MNELREKIQQIINGMANDIVYGKEQAENYCGDVKDLHRFLVDVYEKVIETAVAEEDQAVEAKGSRRDWKKAERLAAQLLSLSKPRKNRHGT